MKNNDTKNTAVHQKVMQRAASPLVETFGLSGRIASFVVFVLFAALAATVFWSIKSAPPKSIIISAGPAGSSFENFARRYHSNLFDAVHIILKIEQSQGSVQNLERLNDPKFKVDVGFVQGGLTNGMEKLISLGSMYNMPLLVFYRGESNIDLLSGFEGKRLAIGPKGSGTRMLAMALLATSGFDTNSTDLLDIDAEAATQALLANKGVDAVFMTGDSASPVLMRKLIHSPGVRLMDFAEADAYARKISYVSAMPLPRGGLDLTNDIPPHDIKLVGTTVELIARPGLHPAVVDQLLESAKKVHGNVGLFRHQGEFPAFDQHDFNISDESVRWHKDGKTFLYKHCPFWLAALVSSFVVFLPVLIVAIPSLRLIPTLLRFRMKIIFYKWYRALLALERQLVGTLPSDKFKQLSQELDEIERGIYKMKVPASFANDYYSLKGHVEFVRERLMETQEGPVPGRVETMA